MMMMMMMMMIMMNDDGDDLIFLNICFTLDVRDFFFKNMKMKISTDKLRNYLLFEGVNFGKKQYETCFFVNLLLLFNE